MRRYSRSKVLMLTLQQCHSLGKSFVDTVVKVTACIVVVAAAAAAMAAAAAAAAGA